MRILDIKLCRQKFSQQSGDEKRLTRIQTLIQIHIEGGLDQQPLAQDDHETFPPDSLCRIVKDDSLKCNCLMADNTLD